MRRASPPGLLSLLLCTAALAGACSRGTEGDPGNQTTSASTGTAGARGTATGDTNPTTPSGVSGTADRTGATAPTGTTGIIGSSGGVPQNADEAPKITAAGSPGSPQSGGEGGGMSGSSNSAPAAPGTAGTLLGQPGLATNAVEGFSRSGSGAAGQAASLGTASAPRAAGASDLDRGDKSFVASAAESGLFEVQAAQLAVARATSGDVKGYATMLVNQHLKANGELAQFAGAHAMSLPTEVPNEMQEELRRLAKGAGKDFDRDFVQAVIKAHERDIAAFETASGKVQDAQLKAWIEKTLPALRQHLDAARQLAKSG